MQLICLVILKLSYHLGIFFTFDMTKSAYLILLYIFKRKNPWRSLKQLLLKCFPCSVQRYEIRLSFLSSKSHRSFLCSDYWISVPRYSNGGKKKTESRNCSLQHRSWFLLTYFKRILAFQNESIHVISSLQYQMLYVKHVIASGK